MVKSKPKMSSKKTSVNKLVKAIKKTGQVKGKGDFFSDAWKGIKGFAKKILGQGLYKGTDWLASRAQDAIKSVVGNGDYLLPGAPVEQNSLYSAASMVPQFSNTKNHANLIQHREPLGVIRSSNAFQRTSITLNPGLSVFPWLSEIAGAWQRYKVHGAIIEWIPAVTPLSTNAGGRVSLSTRYDLSTGAPQSLQQSEVTFGAVAGRPMDQMAMPIECKPSQMAVVALNVRFGDLPVGANAQFFDHCIIDVINQGQADGTSDIGELWITYEVEFMMPIAEHLSHATVASAVKYAATTVAAPAGPVGTNTYTTRAGSSLPFDVTASASTLQIDLDSLQPLPVGSTWIINLEQAANATVTQPSLTLGVDLESYAIFKGAAGNDATSFAIGSGSNTASYDLAFRVKAATTNQSLLFSGFVIAGAGVGYNTITITPVTSGLAQIKMRSRYPHLYELEDRLTKQMEVFNARPKLLIDDDWKHV